MFFFLSPLFLLSFLYSSLYSLFPVHFPFKSSFSLLPLLAYCSPFLILFSSSYPIPFSFLLLPLLHPFSLYIPSCFFLSYLFYFPSSLFGLSLLISIICPSPFYLFTFFSSFQFFLLPLSIYLLFSLYFPSCFFLSSFLFPFFLDSPPPRPPAMV